LTETIQIYACNPAIKTDLAVIPEKMLEGAFEAILELAQLMKGYAQVFVRVDTGSLRDSIRVERGGIGMHWRQVRVRAGGYVTNPDTGRKVDYAGIVEKKYPYMRPALNQVRRQAILIMNRNVKSKLANLVSTNPMC
jgi:hypothetical protein